ncbi:MAG: hypothetical protein CMJ21_05200 [Phycisphaerae bacterium]|nr:hypothetical protein [Phycisphaerae bacterium]
MVNLTESTDSSLILEPLEPRILLSAVNPDEPINLYGTWFDPGLSANVSSIVSAELSASASAAAPQLILGPSDNAATEQPRVGLGLEETIDISPNPLTNGGGITLSVSATDSDGSVTKVEFFRDDNDDRIADAAEKIGEDNDATGGWSISVPVTAPDGDHVYMARAMDDMGAFSDVVNMMRRVIDTGGGGSIVSSLSDDDGGIIANEVANNPPQIVSTNHGPFSGQAALLDTAANAVLLGIFSNLFDETYDEERRTDDSVVQYEELGVSGSELLDLLKPYHLNYIGTEGPQLVIENLRALNGPEVDLGSFSAIVGMPAMIDKAIVLDLFKLVEPTGDPLALPQIGVSFHDTLPVSTAAVSQVFNVPLAQLPVEFTDPIQAGDPRPDFAPIPLIENVTTTRGSMSATGTAVLDTGAQVTIISTAMALAMGIDPDVDFIDLVPVGGIGGTILVPQVQVDTLAIPTVEGTELVFTHLTPLVIDIADLDMVIGMDNLTSGYLEPVLSLVFGGVDTGQSGYFHEVAFDFTGGVAAASAPGQVQASAASTWNMRLTLNPDIGVPVFPEPGDSEVISTVIESSPGVYDYTYEVVNNTLTSTISQWGLPTFDPADTIIIGGLAGITLPAGWSALEIPFISYHDFTYSAGFDDPAKVAQYELPGSEYETPNYVITFFASDLLNPNPIPPFGQSLSFSFQSTFPGGNSPALVRFDDPLLTIADPPIPMGPDHHADAMEPDLVGTSFDTDPDHVLLGLTDITFTIENLGDATSGAGFDVQIVLSDDAIIDGTDTVVATESFTELAAGASVSRTVSSLQLPIAELFGRAINDDPSGGGSNTSTSFDYIGLLIDSGGVIIESNENNNANQGKGSDGDDITFFVWDIDGNGTVTATDAIFVINRLGLNATGANAGADLNGNGVISATDAIAVINRLGLERNDSVIEAPSAPAAPLSAATSDDALYSVFDLVTSNTTPQRSWNIDTIDLFNDPFEEAEQKRRSRFSEI